MVSPADINEDYFPPEVLDIKGRDGPERVTSMDYIHSEIWFDSSFQTCVKCKKEFSKSTLCLHLGEKEVMVPCVDCNGFSIYKKEWARW